MKPTIIFTKTKCEACIACLKACPMNAIVIDNGRVKIEANRCINCIHCLEKCPDHALITHGSSLDTIKDYAYPICLVPSSLLHHYQNNDDIKKLFAAIKKLGFKEVISLSAFEAAAYHYFQTESKPRIASFCPVVKRVVKYDYPTLLEYLSKTDYPSEIAASYLRHKRKDKNLGIFLLAECSAKLSLAKHPYENYQYEVDHALAIRDIFPAIKACLSDESLDVVINQDGFYTANMASYPKCERYLLGDGLEKAFDVLEKLEFKRLEKFDHYVLFACFNGCPGGDLLWGNPYSCQNNYRYIMTERMEDKDIDPLNPRVEKDEVIKATFKERIAFFEEVSKVLKTLPGYDCAACGYPGCRYLAEAIVKKEASRDHCRLLKTEDKIDEDK